MTDDEMLEHAIRFVSHWSDESLKSYQPSYHECGCMGPRDGYPLCSCKMHMWVAQNKDAVLMYRSTMKVSG